MGKEHAFHKEKVWRHFEKNINDYDTCDNFVVPRNEELHKAIIDELPFHKTQDVKILDLGVGTGTGTLSVLSRFANAKLTGVDFSQKMLAKAKEKLSYFGDRAELIEGDFNEIEFPEGFDAVVSAVAIHNSFDEQKKKLFSKIYNCLKPDGIFINGDFVKYSDRFEQTRQDELYRDFLTGGLRGDELKAWLNHAFEDDKPATIDDQFKWLSETGFTDIKLIWHCRNLAVYSARK